MEGVTSTSPAISPEILAGAIQTATEEVLATMLTLEAKAGPWTLERNTSELSDGVVCLIGLAGRWAGTGMICCTATLACKLSALLLMTGPEAEKGGVDGEVLDAMAEITNMIIGNVKNIVEEQLGPMGLSIPTVIYGRNFTTRSVSEGDWTVVRFGCGDEDLDVRVRLVPGREPHPVRHGFPPPQAVQI